jgi:putative methyltransferase (TIGR04325 family)
LAAFNSIKQLIKKIIPNFILERVLKRNSDPEEKSGWFGNYPSWEEAQSNSNGYNQSSILEKIKQSTLKVIRGEAAYERDSVAFLEHEYSPNFLEALQKIQHQKELSIVDFGGSLGSQYFQYKRFFRDVKITWAVVEQNHFVECGKKEIANTELHFFETIEMAQANHHYRGILLSSVLPYIEHPFDLLQKIMDANFDYILIDRTGFINSPSHQLTVQIVSPTVYKASYPAWFFNEAAFLNHFETHYFVEKVLDSPFAMPTFVDGTEVYWKGFLLEKKNV